MLYKTVFGNKFVLHELKKTWALPQTSHFILKFFFFLSVKYHWEFCMVMYLISLCIQYLYMKGEDIPFENKLVIYIANTLKVQT